MGKTSPQGLQRLRTRILRLNRQQDDLKRRIDEIERRKQKELERLQAVCPHPRVMAFTGEVKYPGEKTFFSDLRVCEGCNLVEGRHEKTPKLTAEPIVRADANAMDQYQVLGRKLA